MEIPASIREFSEMSIAQTEKAFDAFINAVNKSVATMPDPAAEISKKALSFAEQNIRTTIDHTRKLIHAKDLRESARLQAEFLLVQFSETVKLLDRSALSTAKDSTDGLAER